MSTNKHTNPAYISHVHLKGYKSIIDTEVELHPGLNIIIGPNGSGKTNFLEYIHRLITFHYPLIPNEFSSELIIKSNEESLFWGIESKGNVINEGTNLPARRIAEKFNPLKNNTTKDKLYQFVKLTELTGQRNKARTSIIKHFQPSIFIWFSSPMTKNPINETYSLENHISLKINKSSLELTDLNISPIYFISNFIIENFSEIRNQKLFEHKNDLHNYLFFNKELIRNLKKFSPIQDIRVGKGIIINDTNQYFNIDYLRFEFLVENLWLNWNQLSNGTKRLFYIITQVSAFDKGINIIEEPEIGVHPNQYLKILTFLKEQAKEKQIIITTHAPKTLDILEDDELDRIILTRYEKDLGTKMRHLSKEEQEHAVKFMKEESFFLSDFWTLTSFFDEEEEVA